MGQWLYGRIYERRCDLSPDGRHLIYFAMNGRWTSAVKGSWTAISRAPFLKATTLFAKGDCWHGGGLFSSSREYWLNDGYGHQTHHDHCGLSRSNTYPWHEFYGGECPGVYYVRLQRDGWQISGCASSHAHDQVVVFERRINAHWLLRKRAHATLDRPVGRGCYFDEHELCNSRTGEIIDARTWEWADVDGNRIVWASEGKLFAGHVGSRGLGSVRELHDFNAMRFERLAAPY